MKLRKQIGYNRHVLGNKALPTILRSAFSSKQLEYLLHSEKIKEPILLRTMSSDVFLYREIFRKQEYLFEEIKEPSIIVDAGANIGLTSIWFANKYPKATILAIEPEKINFELLCRNTKKYENIITLNAALWKKDEPISLIDPCIDHSSFRVGEGSNSNDSLVVEGFTVETILKKYQFERIDLLKIDIEGAEKDLFETREPWLEQIGMIIIELHDRFRQGCSRNFYRATQDFEYQSYNGENVLLARNDWIRS